MHEKTLWVSYFLRYQFQKIHRCTFKQIEDISIEHRTTSICEKQSAAEVQLVHAKEMSLWNFITIYIYIYIHTYINIKLMLDWSGPYYKNKVFL